VLRQVGTGVVAGGRDQVFNILAFGEHRPARKILARRGDSSLRRKILKRKSCI
jgi:hypothetical protein